MFAKQQQEARLGCHKLGAFFATPTQASCVSCRPPMRHLKRLELLMLWQLHELLGGDPEPSR